MKIFLLEDDMSLLKGISFKLFKEGYEVVCCESYTAAEAVILDGQKFDLFLLDVNLNDSAGRTGLDFAVFIRRRIPDVYIIFLTARDSEIDTVNGYESGADDYITKPFSLAVLISKISALKRRIEIAGIEKTADISEIFRFDSNSCCVYIHEKKIDLTKTEYKLFYKLVSNKNITLSKKQLLESMWNTDEEYIDDNTLAVNIRRLREKIEKNPSYPEYIHNIRGIGYVFKENG